MKREPSSKSGILGKTDLWLFTPSSDSFEWMKRKGIIALSLWQEVRGAYMDVRTGEVLDCNIPRGFVDKRLMETGKTFMDKMKKGDYVVAYVPSIHTFELDGSSKAKIVEKDDEHMLVGEMKSGPIALEYDKERYRRNASYREYMWSKRYQRRVSWKRKIYIRNVEKTSELADVVDVLKYLPKPAVLRMTSHLDVVMEVL